jgi:methyltransferase-like protein
LFQKSDKIGLKEIHWRQATQINGALMRTYITICEEKKRKKEKKRKEKKRKKTDHFIEASRPVLGSY